MGRRSSRSSVVSAVSPGCNKVIEASLEVGFAWRPEMIIEWVIVAVLWSGDVVHDEDFLLGYHGVESSWSCRLPILACTRQPAALMTVGCCVTPSWPFYHVILGGEISEYQNTQPPSFERF